MKMFCGVLATALAIGCSKGPSSPAPAGPTKAGGVVAPAGDAPDGARFVCYLECSGTQAKGYGATEEAAHADVRRHVKTNCKPEDGQYFIFCDPLE
jgi:hypothetical protein